MTLLLAKRTANEAAMLLAQKLGCVTDNAALQLAIASEHIRGTLYANVARTRDLNIGPAVHTTRLMTSARKTLDLVWPQTASVVLAGQQDVSQLALESLAALGDVVDTGGGYWIGAPLRLIENSDDASLAILGAAPSITVKAILGAVPISVGVGRFAEKRPISANRTFEPFIQSVDEWLGNDEGLTPWTHRLLEQHRQKLVSSGEVLADQLEIYAPDIFAIQRQRGRWLEARQLAKPLPELRLCRPLKSVSREWARPYYLAEFGLRSGQAILLRSASIDFKWTLRLRFGLDVELKAPRTVQIVNGPETFEADIPYNLPQPEARVIALGWSSPARKGRFIFHKLAKPAVMRAFERLGISVDARRGSNDG